MEKQFQALADKPDIIVATPGRLAHHLSEIPDFKLRDCEVCVYDEADRLFEMGFAAQIREITKSMPELRQTLLFSATMPKALAEFAKSGLQDPSVVRLDNEANVSDELRVGFLTCRSADKDATLLYLLRSVIPVDKDKLTLVFAATRHHVEFLTNLIKSTGIDATCIYGSMDMEARKSNLASFRNGHTPVLVVTDVAARGIDVPLITTVIHHSFPPSAKLFVHRSGRAARAGRIGYCLAIAEPDEVPFMVELHLFLGRKLSTSKVEGSGDEVTEDLKYSLEEMTPDMVHYGSIPEIVITEEVENCRRLIENESGNRDAENLKALVRTCNNAMKQYRRSRPEPSKSSIRTAKALLTPAPPPHPLLANIVSKNLHKAGTSFKDVIAREDFLRNLGKLKVKETIFESMAKDGGSTNAGSIDRTRNTKSINGNTLTIMKAMRRQLKLVQNKNSLVVAGSDTAKVQNGELVEDEVGPETGDCAADNSFTANSTTKPMVAPVTSKRRLSKAERKRLKAGKAIGDKIEDDSNRREKHKLKSNYRDSDNYISFDTNAHNATEREKHMENQLLPSATESKYDPKVNALRLQESILDIVGDEREDMVKQQRVMRWDKSKRKYIQTTIGEEAQGMSKSKKLRLESGQIVQRKGMKLGELYEKWQKRNKASIGRTGAFDEVTAAEDGDNDNAAAQIRKRHGLSSNKGKGKNSKQEINDSSSKTATQIQKERSQKQNTRLKNMKKKDRREVEAEQRRNKDEHKKGYRGKMEGKVWSSKKRK